jgi:predicted transcriptional regulator
MMNDVTQRREALRLSQVRLARSADVARNSLRRLEDGLPVRDAIKRRIERALEAAEREAAPGAPGEGR